MNLPPSVTLIEEPAGYPVLVINHAAASGRIALNGAHVMEWTPAGEKPVLYMSPQALLEPGKAIRGGVPVCWPWFGPHPMESDKPAHGFVRNLMWEIGEVTENFAGVKLQFHLRDSDASRAFWPHAFELRFEVKMGAQLGMALHIKNTSAEAWSMTGALHTYLCVEDVTEAAVIGLDDAFYVESRLSPERIEQSGPVYFDREVDRNYESRDTVRLLDKKGRRTIVVEKSGSRATIVWNPWIDKSKRLADLPDDAYPHFVCIEAANAVPDVIAMPPGKEHVLEQRLRVQKN
ncbi:D-hexose-6-phosphate mutarotase [Prosthecobacter sp.]|jgi:glucose-6-phosphate 1-epimerase|uniref:D-hexose-6-phosphate mutarotase n=1 Tax=Prosthecobacter sp. TaxID=1965333 RepID=UPI003783D282